MPGAWISGQPRARVVSPGKFNPVIYVAKCWVPAAPHRLVFSDTEAVTGASFTATSGCLRVPRTAGRTAPDVNDRCPRLSSNLAMSRATSAVSWTPIGSLTGVVRLAGLGHENHLPRMTLWSKTSRERLSVARHRRRRPEARPVRLQHHHSLPPSWRSTGSPQRLVGRRASCPMSPGRRWSGLPWGHRARHRGGSTPGRLATRPRQIRAARIVLEERS